MTSMPLPVLPRPYPHTHLDAWSDNDWLRVPATAVSITDLVPSQSGLCLRAFARVVNGGPSESGDPAGRAVRYRGCLHLHDGHHRWALAWARGEPTFNVRIVEVP